ncbi:MAG: hypothetical protein ACE5JR_09845 [Gemmatimonadota bacterium]
MTRLLSRSASILAAALLAGPIWLGCTDQTGEPTAPAEPQLSLSIPIDQDVFAAAIAAQERRTEHLLSVPGVVGTAVGLSGSGRPAVKVYVETADLAGLPRKIDGVPVVVEVTGEIFALQEAKRCENPPNCKGGNGGGGGADDPPVDRTARFDRPVPIGVSTGHPDITAGTIGARVIKGANVYALSNNHVYAKSNTASIGDAVIQPGTFDGGSSPADDIGTLSDFEPINFSGGNNVIDAAIAASSPALLGNATPSDGYGTPRSTTKVASINLRVMKYGRTTGQTKGRITGINATVNVFYGSPGVARFVNQIVIGGGGFSAGGDSGSLIVVQKGEDQGKPVGLLFAGSSSVTIANPIDAVLTRFGVTIDGL